MVTVTYKQSVSGGIFKKSTPPDIFPNTDEVKFETEAVLIMVNATVIEAIPRENVLKVTIERNEEKKS